MAGEEVLIDLMDTGMKIIQRNDHFNFSIDTVLLSGFATINYKSKKIIELGSGNGALLLFLSLRTTAKLFGMEILESSHKLALKNIEINNLENRIELINGDLLENENYFDQQEFDLVVSNPPFFEYEEKTTAIKENPKLNQARHELNSSLEDFVKSAARLLKNGGYFAMVHRPERVVDILTLMRKYRLEPKRMANCYTKKGTDAKILLIESVKNGVSGLKILPPIYLHDESGGYSDIVKKMYGGKIVDFYED